MKRPRNKAPRVDRQLAYLLHTRPYTESSLLLDVFTRDFGHVRLLARGARGAQSALRGLTYPFQPMWISWFGDKDINTLHSIEWQGGVPALCGQPLLTGFYLNELLLKLTHLQEKLPPVWDAYDTAIRQLAASQRQASAAVKVGICLRQFEITFIHALGYAPPFEGDEDGQAIRAEMHYLCTVDTPPKVLRHETPAQADWVKLQGNTLLQLQARMFDAPEQAKLAYPWIKLALNTLLNHQPLASRRLLTALQ